MKVTVTDATTYVDHFVKRRIGAALREKIDMSFHAVKSGWHAMFEFPTADIVEIVIQPFEAVLAVGGAGVSVPVGDTGVSVGGLGGSVRQQQWSGVSFVLGDGQRVLFKTFGPPVAVQTELAALIQFVHGRVSEPARPASENEPADRYRQLRELAALREDGILSEDEFEREKERLLRDDPSSQA